MSGKVWLVGAGPGDPELLTVRAHRLISDARILAHDELIPEAVLALAPQALRIPVGRRAAHVAGGRCLSHDGPLHPAVLEHALAGHCVVRLKQGDPMIFGRGGEEALALARAGVDVEIVPGVTAATATRLPLTHRKVSQQVTFATAHARTDDDAWPRHLASAMPRTGTLVLYMATLSIERVAGALVEAGWSPNTPLRIVSHASWPDESCIDATLKTVRATLATHTVSLPAIIVVGDVVDVQRAIEEA